MTVTVWHWILLGIVLWFGGAIAAAAISMRKGRRGLGVVLFLASLVLSPIIGMLVAVLIKPAEAPIVDGDYISCPQCAEMILSNAKVCPVCGALLVVDLRA
jgi:hypothetical protein